jgi:hypothetical protein
MRLSLNIPLFFAALLLASTPARADDSASAVDELKQGYARKQGGQCREAIPHFVRSVSLGATPKALLNLADCEGQTGDLVAAQRHATQGRDLARDKNGVELVGVATTQLTALDARLPRLTVALSSGAPRDSVITCDGVVIDATSIGVPFALNPGEHAVVVSAKSYTSRTYRIALAEGARSRVEVEPGEAVDASATAPTSATTAHASRETSDASTPGLRRPIAVGLAAIGVVGLAVGVVTGLGAGSKHTALEGECPGNMCPSTAQNDLDSFRSERTLSTIFYVVGFAGLAGGAALWLTAPSIQTSSAARMWIGPTSAGVAGEF